MKPPRASHRSLTGRLTNSSRRRAVGLAAALLAFTAPAARAANYYWDPGLLGADPGSGGTSAWDAVSADWHLAGAAGDAAWPNTLTNTATFAGSAGTVTTSGSSPTPPPTQPRVWGHCS